MIHIKLVHIIQRQYFCDNIKKHIMENIKTIGELIELEVRKQGIPITVFAKLINCQRNNVYDIFKRNTIDIALLANISKVLKHNFFEDVAKDYSLVERPYENAVKQFMDIVPKVMIELGKDPTISFGANGLFDMVLPDYMLSKYCITFTIGCTWVEKSGELSNQLFEIQKFTEGNKTFYSVINKIHQSQMIDIMIDFKTHDEWKDLLEYVFHTFPNLNCNIHGKQH